MDVISETGHLGEGSTVKKWLLDNGRGVLYVGGAVRRISDFLNTLL